MARCGTVPYDEAIAWEKVSLHAWGMPEATAAAQHKGCSREATVQRRTPRALESCEATGGTAVSRHGPVVKAYPTVVKVYPTVVKAYPCGELRGILRLACH